MTKFSGMVGYVTQGETVPGVWSSIENPVLMRGDVIRAGLSRQNDNKVNNDVALNHRVSVLGDAYAFQQYFNIKWVELDGMKWEVTSVELQRPRIILSLGGMWNG